MDETSNIPVLVSLANTVFVSIVFVFWYFGFQMWQEEGSKQEENKEVIINAEESNCKAEVGNDESAPGEIKNNDEKHLYVKNGENVLNNGYTFCYHQNATNKYANEDLQINTANKNNVSTEAVVQEQSEKLSDTTFQWPEHETTIENLRSYQNKTPVSQSLLEKLDCLGIRRDDTKPLEGQDMDTSVKVCDRARRSGQLANRKHIRITWDNFLAKARPGLEMDADLSPRKSHNYQRKQKNMKQNKLETSGKQTTNFIRKIKPDNCVNFVRVL